MGRIIDLSQERDRRRLQARPRVVPCIGGTVCLTVGAEETERELADAIDKARFLLRVEREAERDG
jgi:hypothetical protein